MGAQISHDRPIAIERIGRIARVTQRLEAHRARIDHQEAADQSVAKTDDLADRLQRHHRTHHARKRAHDTGLGAGRHRAGRRRLRKQAAIGRIEDAVGVFLMRADGGERAVEGAERRRDQRLPGEEAGVRGQIAGREIVGAVEHEVVIADQRQRIVGIEPGGMADKAHMRIERGDPLGGALDLVPADIGRRMDDLALKIGQRHHVVIDHAERAYAGGGQIHQGRRAGARRRRSPAPTPASTRPGRDHRHRAARYGGHSVRVRPGSAIFSVLP